MDLFGPLTAPDGSAQTGLENGVSVMGDPEKTDKTEEPTPATRLIKLAEMIAADADEQKKRREAAEAKKAIEQPKPKSNVTVLGTGSPQQPASLKMRNRSPSRNGSRVS
jgi:hypothetical protein